MEVFAVLFVLGLLACLLVGFIQILVWVVRLFSGSKPHAHPITPEPAVTSPPNKCNGCGARLKQYDQFCMQCGLRRQATAHSPETDLVAAQRALLRLFNLKRIDENLYQSLAQTLTAEQEQLRTEAGVKQTAAQGEPTPIRQATSLQPDRTVINQVKQPSPSPRHPVTPSPAPLPKEPRRSLPEMLAAFMEESSIRWGELVGGLLIIGCSLALVVSLWSEIAERPFLKFSVFMSMTAALFGLGFYSAHRWKLPTTSRGVLLTATLLVSLNFLAVTALGRASSGVGIVLAEIVAWFVFTVLVWRGAQVYAAEHSQWIAASTMGVSLALLAAKHLAAPTLNWTNWLLLGALPVACFVASVVGSLRQARQQLTSESPIQPAQLYQLFAVVGTGLFAALLPLGLLLARGGLSRRTWQELVPLLALLGVPLMAAGWFGWRRIQSKELATERTIATSIGLAGAALLAGSTLLAFPLVDAMLAVALLNALIFGWAAWRYSLRAARWLSLAQALYASLLLLHLAWGNLQLGLSNAWQLLSALFSYPTGIWLFIVTVALLWLAELLRTRTASPARLRLDAQFAAAICGIASFTLVTYHGFGWLNDPLKAVWLYVAYTLLAFALAWRHEFSPFAWLGMALLWMTSVQACVYTLQPTWQWNEPWAVAWQVTAILAALIALGSLFNERATRVFGHSALLTAAACVVWATPLLIINPKTYAVTYLLPPFVVALTWSLFAWRKTRPTIAMGGGLLFNLAASLVMLRWLALDDLTPLALIPLRLIQINLAASTLYALVWFGVTRRSTPAWDSPHYFWVLRLSRLVAALWLALLGFTAALVISSPWRVSQFTRGVGGGWGWALAVLVAGTYTLIKNNHHPNRLRSFSLRMLAGLALGVQTAACIHRWENEWAWQAYFTLAGFVTLTALVAVAYAAYVSRRAQRVESNRATLWVNGLSFAAVLLAWRGTELNQGPWRSVAILSSITVAMLVMQGVRKSRAYAYAAGALACGTLTMWIWGYATGNGTPLEVLLLNGITLAAIAVISLLIELRTGVPAKAAAPAFHQFVAFVLLAMTTWWMVAKLWHDFTGTSDSWIAARGIYTLLFFGTLAALLIAGWWDATHRWRFAAMYWFGLLVATALIDRRNLFGAQLLFCLSIVGTLYALGAALLWRSRPVIAAPLQAAHVPEIESSIAAEPWWLTPANTSVAMVSVTLATFLSSVMEPSRARTLTTLVSLLAPLSLYLLIAKSSRSAFVAPPLGGESEANSDRLMAELPTRQLSTRWLTLALMFSAILGCAWLGVSAQFTHQLVIFTALSLLVSGVFFLSEARPLSNWTAWLARFSAWEISLRQFINLIGLLGLTALIGTLALEWGQRLDFGAPQLAAWAAGLVTALFVAFLLSLLAFALWPGRDPLDWQGTARGRYVYGAEIIAILLFIHLRLVAPWLFSGRFQAWWPIIILLLAFIGVTLSDLLRRRGRTVLADPLERTGIFLPLLPALAYGLAPSHVDYAGVLLGVALFYGLWSVMRQSFGFALLAILAGNGGWWHWLQRTGDFGFFAHPQVWLIPAALSVLLAAHLNRKQLSLEQLTTIRYVALMTIYVSSTADIFLNGVADSPWLPLILAVLSIGGVMMGIMLRVRAYLFLGTTFLLLAVITLVWHAAVSFGWRWLWYVAGIAFGMAIIYLFAMFERHRTAWLLWMERFKSWQA